MGEAGVLGGVEGAGGWRMQIERQRAASRGGGNVMDSGVGILQLLAPNQSKLVPVLGKKTGWDELVDKRTECASLGNEWALVTGR